MIPKNTEMIGTLQVYRVGAARSNDAPLTRRRAFCGGRLQRLVELNPPSADR